MKNPSIRFAGLRRSLWFTVALTWLAGGAFIGLAVVDTVQAIAAGGEMAWLAGVAKCAAGLGLWGFGGIVLCLVQFQGKIEAHGWRSYDALLDLKEGLEEQTRLLRAIQENTQISEAARSIAHREHEQRTLRQAITEDILREDWEAAYYLVEQLEKRFGYKREADELRHQIDTSRTTLIEGKIQEAVTQINDFMSSYQWDHAHRAVDHLTRHHPNHPKVRTLPQELETRRSEHKRRLLKEWDQAVQRDEVDHGIGVLRELDQYLTPREAQALKEAARDVFKAKLHNMGVQFSLAVTEGRWTQALDIGQQIMSEFPNSRMAREVSDHLEALRKRAAGA